jgi:hypothetical protein
MMPQARQKAATVGVACSAGSEVDDGNYLIPSTAESLGSAPLMRLVRMATAKSYTNGRRYVDLSLTPHDYTHPDDITMSKYVSRRDGESNLVE